MGTPWHKGEESPSNTSLCSTSRRVRYTILRPSSSRVCRLPISWSPPTGSSSRAGPPLTRRGIKGNICYGLKPFFRTAADVELWMETCDQVLWDFQNSFLVCCAVLRDGFGLCTLCHPPPHQATAAVCNSDAGISNQSAGAATSATPSLPPCVLRPQRLLAAASVRHLDNRPQKRSATSEFLWRSQVRFLPSRELIVRGSASSSPQSFFFRVPARCNEFRDCELKVGKCMPAILLLLLAVIMRTCSISALCLFAVIIHGIMKPDLCALESLCE